MVKVTRDHAAANREALVEAAGRLFRQRGVDGVGVAELCESAGLTHGALYSRFGSKAELAAEAFKQGQSVSRQRMIEACGPAPDLASVVEFYVSPRHRDNLADCCPMLASTSEAARQDKDFGSSFAAALKDFRDIVRAALDKEGTRDVDLSLPICASMIGAVSVARALKPVDPALSEALLAASRFAVMRLAESTKATMRRERRARTVEKPRRKPRPVTRKNTSTLVPKEAE